MKTVSLLRAALFGALTFAALPAFAGDWYVGLSAGEASTDDELVGAREATFPNSPNLATTFDDTDTAWKATFGYRFSTWFSLEANYADYGSTYTNTTFDVVGGATGRGGVAIDRDVEGYGVDAVFTIPVSETFGVFARAGVVNAQTDAVAQLSGDTHFTDGTPGTRRSTSHDETTGRYGIGLDWSFSPQWTLRGEWERLPDIGKQFSIGGRNTTGEADIDAWTVGLLYRF